MRRTQTVYVTSSEGVEIRPPRGGRDSLFIQNNSTDVIYYSEDTPASAENGIQIAGAQYLSIDQTQARAVPQGNIWILGSTAARQAVIVKEG